MARDEHKENVGEEEKLSKWNSMLLRTYFGDRRDETLVINTGPMQIRLWKLPEGK